MRLLTRHHRYLGSEWSPSRVSHIGTGLLATLHTLDASAASSDGAEEYTRPCPAPLFSPLLPAALNSPYLGFPTASRAHSSSCHATVTPRTQTTPNLAEDFVSPDRCTATSSSCVLLRTQKSTKIAVGGLIRAVPRTGSVAPDVGATAGTVRKRGDALRPLLLLLLSAAEVPKWSKIDVM